MTIYPAAWITLCAFTLSVALGILFGIYPGGKGPPGSSPWKHCGQNERERLMKRRIMTFLLAVCMAVSLLAVPAGAANTAAVTFSDVGDKSTAVAVESLRLLGVLDG